MGKASLLFVLVCLLIKSVATAGRESWRSLRDGACTIHASGRMGRIPQRIRVALDHLGGIERGLARWCAADTASVRFLLYEYVMV